MSDSLTTETSQEIRSDRAPAHLIVTDMSAGGGIDFEFSYGSYDDFLEDAFMGTWTDIGQNIALGFLAQDDDNVTTAVADGFANIPVGASFFVSGGSDPALDRVYAVTAKSTNNQTMTVTPAPSVAGNAAAIAGEVLVNGVVTRSYSIMKRFNDADPVARQLYTGMRVTGFSLDMSTGAILSGSWNFLGRDANWIDAEIAGSTTLDAHTTPVMNAVDNIHVIQIDGEDVCSTGAVSNLNMEWDNGYREQKGLCRMGAVGVVAGILNISISGSLYFKNSKEAEKAKASRDFSLLIGMQDSLGNQYFWNFRRVKYTSYEANATGLGSDVMGEMTMTPLLDPVSGTVAILTRIPA